MKKLTPIIMWTVLGMAVAFILAPAGSLRYVVARLFWRPAEKQQAHKAAENFDKTLDAIAVSAMEKGGGGNGPVLLPPEDLADAMNESF